MIQITLSNLQLNWFIFVLFEAKQYEASTRRNGASIKDIALEPIRETPARINMHIHHWNIKIALFTVLKIIHTDIIGFTISS